jgi:hypothetical protein
MLWIRIRDPVPFWPLDPGSVAFMTPGSGIWDGEKIRIRIRDHRTNFWGLTKTKENLFKKLTLCIRTGSKKSVLQIRSRDPVPFWPLDPGSGIGFFRISDPESQTHIYESVVTIFWVKSSIPVILWKSGQIFFLQHFKKKIIYNFLKFMAAKKRYDNWFIFTPLIYCYFWIRDPGWVKIRIRDKYPGSATLQKGWFSVAPHLCIPLHKPRPWRWQMIWPNWVFMAGSTGVKERTSATMLCSGFSANLKQRVSQTLNVKWNKKEGMRFRINWNRFIEWLNCVAIGIIKLAKSNKLFTNFVVYGNVKVKRPSALILLIRESGHKL